MKTGWKATCLIPDYVFDENGDIQIGLEKNRRIVKIVKFKDDEFTSKRLWPARPLEFHGK